MLSGVFLRNESTQAHEDLSSKALVARDQETYFVILTMTKFTLSTAALLSVPRQQKVKGAIFRLDEALGSSGNMTA